jgi:hypothetical protein
MSTTADERQPLLSNSDNSNAPPHYVIPVPVSEEQQENAEEMRKDIEQEKKIGNWFEIFVWLLCASGFALVVAFAIKAGNNGKVR